MASQTHQLDRLGRELKCPICLSLLQQAASLTCNHTFCRSCIQQSMKSKPACPICKVPTTRREVRAAPQMDSLVAIFVSMGSAAGLDIMTSQNMPATGEPTQPPTTSNGRSVLSNITNYQKSPHLSKGESTPSNYTFKGAIPAKKRVQVPLPATLQAELKANRDGMHSTPHSHLLADNCGLTTEGASPKSSSKSKRQHKRKLSSNDLDVNGGHPSSSKKVHKAVKGLEYSINPSCSKLDSEAHGKEQETLKEASAHVIANPRTHAKKKGNSMVPSPGKQLISNVEKDSYLSVRDDSSRRKLDPFFWLRDESSQEMDAIRVTQLTLTQSTVRPNFSDLKDSDDEVGVDASEDIHNHNGICEPGSYDSDDFDWTQHPSSPELRCSPSKKQKNTKDLVIDISLEAPDLSPKELLLDDKGVCKRPSQETISAEALLESGYKVSSTAGEVLNAALKEDKKRRKSGRIISHPKTHKPVDVSEQQNNQAGCSNYSQSQVPVCDIIPPKEIKKIKRIASSTKNAEKPNKLKRKRVQEKNVAGCSMRPTTTDNQPHNVAALEELKLKKSGASTKRNHQKLDKISKSKLCSETNLGDATIDDALPKSERSKNPSEPCLPVCVFCGTSKGSQVTGSLMHFNQQGIPLAGLPGQDGKVIHVHKHCAEWAPDVYFVEDEARNLSAEASRGLKIKCFSCGKRGAALGCCIKRCRRSYHYPCARALSCKWEEERFIMLCPEHKSEKFPVKKNRRHRVSAQKSGSNIQIKLPEHAEAGKIEEISVKWTSSQSSKWVLCGSALDAAGKNQLATFAKITGATISKAWSLNVTHVIAGTDLHGAARRTMKFLMAILEGKWVVKLDWLAACIEAGKPVGEEPYEIGSDIHGAMEGPKQGRLRAAGEKAKLFGKLQFYFMPDFVPSYKGDLQALVVAGGGSFLHRKPVASIDDDAGRRETVVVYNNEIPSSDKKADRGKLLNRRQVEAQELAACVGANVVPHQWILDSIAASKVQPLK